MLAQRTVVLQAAARKSPLKPGQADEDLRFCTMKERSRCDSLMSSGAAEGSQQNRGGSSMSRGRYSRGVSVSVVKVSGADRAERQMARSGYCQERCLNSGCRSYCFRHEGHSEAHICDNCNRRGYIALRGATGRGLRGPEARTARAAEEVPSSSPVEAPLREKPRGPLLRSKAKAKSPSERPMPPWSIPQPRSSGSKRAPPREDPEGVPRNPKKKKPRYHFLLLRRRKSDSAEDFDGESQRAKTRGELADDCLTPSRGFHTPSALSLIHISEPTRPRLISYAVFCLKKKK